MFKPIQLGRENLSGQELSDDRKKCAKFGPCGVGDKALYLNSFYVDRRYYVPFSSVTRVFKRVAMSKGGFSGKGIFASIPYLVVEYDGGKEKQCNFKYEDQVDRMLHCIGRNHPEIKLVSEAAEKRLEERERERRMRRLPNLPPEARREADRLNEAASYLEERPELSLELSQAARRRRAYEKSCPSYRWAAFAISVLGAASLIYGIFSLSRHAEFAIYFTLFGIAAIFLFSGFSMLPTSKNNKSYILNRDKKAKEAMEEYIENYRERGEAVEDRTEMPSEEKTLSEREKSSGKRMLSEEKKPSGGSFPLPARYAHPVVLKRMIDAIEDGRAASAKEALEVLKGELRALNSGVEVDQEEYEEVVAIKALFLNADYR